jgi:hypothetical protein
MSHLVRRSDGDPIDLVLFDEPAEDAAILLRFPGSMGDVPAMLAQQILDIAALERLDGGTTRAAEVGDSGASRRAGRVTVIIANRDVRWLDDCTIAVHDGPLNHVVQLSDVARPRMGR